MMGRVAFLAVGVAVIAVMAAALFSFAPNDSEEATDVIILMGQSNADYREQTAVPADASPVPAPGTAWYYGTEEMPADFYTQRSSCGVWPISDENGARIGDKWPSLAASYTEATGRNVAMFQLAKVGVSIKTFNPKDIDEGYLWARCEPMTKAALSAFEDAGMSIGRVSVVWVQGESDHSMTAEEYETRMMILFTTVLNGGLGTHVDGPIWINKVRESKTPNIAAAQVEFCSDHPGVARIASEVADGFTVSNGLMSADNTHYSQAGNNLIGEAVGEVVGENSEKSIAKDHTLWILIGVGVLIAIVAALPKFLE